MNPHNVRRELAMAIEFVSQFEDPPGPPALASPLLTTLRDADFVIEDLWNQVTVAKQHLELLMGPPSGWDELLLGQERVEFIRTNAVSLLLARDERIERQSAAITHLEASIAGMRKERRRADQRFAALSAAFRQLELDLRRAITEGTRPEGSEWQGVRGDTPAPSG